MNQLQLSYIIYRKKKWTILHCTILWVKLNGMREREREFERWVRHVTFEICYYCVKLIEVEFTTTKVKM